MFYLQSTVLVPAGPPSYKPQHQSCLLHTFHELFSRPSHQLRYELGRVQKIAAGLRMIFLGARKIFVGDRKIFAGFQRMLAVFRKIASSPFPRLGRSLVLSTIFLSYFPSVRFPLLKIDALSPLLDERPCLKCTNRILPFCGHLVFLRGFLHLNLPRGSLIFEDILVKRLSSKKCLGSWGYK